MKVKKYKTRVYMLNSNVQYEFEARDEAHAREIAGRIITEGLWKIEPNGDHVYYPVSQIFKVKVSRGIR